MNYTDPSGHCIVVVVGDALVCALIVGGIVVAIVYVISYFALPPVREVARAAVNEIVSECGRIIEGALRTSGDPFLPPIPQPHATPTRDEPVRRVLVVGESTASNFDYSRKLAAKHQDWAVIGSSFDPSNSQDIYDFRGNLTLLNNVDATRLEDGRYTNVYRYDAVVFNAPKAASSREEGWTSH